MIRFSNTKKYKAIYLILYSACLVLIGQSKSHVLLKILIWIVICLLFFHLLRRLYTVLRTRTFIFQVKSFTFGFKKRLLASEEEDIKKFNNDTTISKEKLSEKRKDMFFKLWFFNRFFRKLSRYIQGFQGRRIIAGYFVIAVLVTIFNTTIIYGFSYYALQKIYPASIAGLNPYNILDSLYFSFTIISTVNFDNTYPIHEFAKLLATLEIASGLFIGVILFFIFTTISFERYISELNDFSKDLKKYEKEISDLIMKYYNMDYREVYLEYSRQEKGKKTYRTSKFFQLENREMSEYRT